MYSRAYVGNEAADVICGLFNWVGSLLLVFWLELLLWWTERDRRAWTTLKLLKFGRALPRNIRVEILWLLICEFSLLHSVTAETHVSTMDLWNAGKLGLRELGVERLFFGDSWDHIRSLRYSGLQNISISSERVLEKLGAHHWNRMSVPTLLNVVCKCDGSYPFVDISHFYRLVCKAVIRIFPCGVMNLLRLQFPWGPIFQIGA